jgi:hypothetical protein
MGISTQWLWAKDWRKLFLFNQSPIDVQHICGQAFASRG